MNSNTSLRSSSLSFNRQNNSVSIKSVMEVVDLFNENLVFKPPISNSPSIDATAESTNYRATLPVHKSPFNSINNHILNSTTSPSPDSITSSTFTKSTASPHILSPGEETNKSVAVSTVSQNIILNNNEMHFNQTPPHPATIDLTVRLTYTNDISSIINHFKTSGNLNIEDTFFGIMMNLTFMDMRQSIFSESVEFMNWFINLKELNSILHSTKFHYHIISVEFLNSLILNLKEKKMIRSEIIDKTSQLKKDNTAKSGSLGRKSLSLFNSMYSKSDSGVNGSHVMTLNSITYSDILILVLWWNRKFDMSNEIYFLHESHELVSLLKNNISFKDIPRVVLIKKLSTHLDGVGGKKQDTDKIESDEWNTFTIFNEQIALIIKLAFEAYEEDNIKENNVKKTNSTFFSKIRKSSLSSPNLFNLESLLE